MLVSWTQAHLTMVARKKQAADVHRHAGICDPVASGCWHRPPPHCARFRLPFWLLSRGLQDVLPKGDPVARTRKTFRLVGLMPDDRFVAQVALGSQQSPEPATSWPWPAPKSSTRESWRS